MHMLISWSGLRRLCAERQASAARGLLRVGCMPWLGAVPLLRPTENALTIAVADHPIVSSHD